MATLTFADMPLALCDWPRCTSAAAYYAAWDYYEDGDDQAQRTDGYFCASHLTPQIKHALDTHHEIAVEVMACGA